MSQMKIPVDVSSIKDPSLFQSAVANVLNQIHVILNGQIEFDQNIHSQSATKLVPNTFPIAFQHKLMKTGVKFIVVDKDGPGDLYHVKVRDTIDTIYLQSTTAGVTYSVVLF
jgi:hypothetical protein